MSVLTSYIQLPGCRHRAGEEPDFARMGFARLITTKGVRCQGIEDACKTPDKVGGLQSKPDKKEGEGECVCWGPSSVWGDKKVLEMDDDDVCTKT